MRLRRILALMLLGGAFGCPSPPPRFGGGAADGVVDSLDEGGDGDDADGKGDGGSDSGDGDGNPSEDTASDATEGSDTASDGCPGGVDPGDSCNPFDDTCPECTKCVPYSSTGESWDSNACAPIQPDAAGLGEPCSFVVGSGTAAVDTCDAGLYCWSDNNTGMGTCVEHCQGSSGNGSCPDPNQTCYEDAAITACVDRCNPLQQDCGLGFGCYPLNAEMFGCAYDGSGGTIGIGSECNYLNDCKPGLMCVGAQAVPGCTGTTGCCTPFCDTYDTTFSCPIAGQTCVEFFAMPPAGYENVGLCAAS